MKRSANSPSGAYGGRLDLSSLPIDARRAGSVTRATWRRRVRKSERMRPRSNIPRHGMTTRFSSKQSPTAWASQWRGLRPTNARARKSFSPRTVSRPRWPSTRHTCGNCANRPRWQLAFQSRSGSPRERWLEPDIGDALRALSGRAAVVMPLGLLCDHVEVLYDLDVEAARIARAAGVRMERAATVGDHPYFIEMMASIARKHLKA